MWYPKIASLREVLDEIKEKYGLSEDPKDIRYFSYKGIEIDPVCIPNLMEKTATVVYKLLVGQGIMTACFLKPLYKSDNVVYKPESLRMYEELQAKKKNVTFQVDILSGDKVLKTVICNTSEEVERVVSRYKNTHLVDLIKVYKVKKTFVKEIASHA